MKDYSELERSFDDFFNSPESRVFAASELQEIRHFVDVREFGLALETAIDIVIERDHVISEKLLVSFICLAEVMELDLTEKLALIRQNNTGMQ